MKSAKGNDAHVVSESARELDADGHLREAINALQEAAWQLRVASYTLEEEQASLSPTVRQSERHAMETGACLSIADLLATQVEAIRTQTRRLRKRAREI